MLLTKNDMRRGKKKVSKADAEFMKCKLSLNINPTFQELFLGIGKDFRFDNYSLNSLLDIEIYAKCSRHKKFFGRVLVQNMFNSIF